MMKQELDREIDALLRAHTRRDDGVEFRKDDAHLDADEVNAYAEGALPSATRALYVAHLADCDRCRRLVTRVALASGMMERAAQGEASERQRAVAETPSAATAQTSRSAAWRRWFAPRVWRLAAPFAALLLLGVTLFVVLRPAHDAQVAQIASSVDAPSSPMQQSSGAPASITATNNVEVAATSTATTDSVRASAAGAKPSPSLRASSTADTAARDDSEITTTRAPREAKSAAAPIPPPPTDTAAAPPAASAAASVAADRPSTDNSTTLIEPPPVNDKAVASLSMKSSAQNEQARRDKRNVIEAEGAQKNESAKRESDSTLKQTPSPNDERFAKDADEVARTNDNQAAAPRARSMRRAPPATPPRESDAARESEAAGKEETRSIAGHRFRRQGAGAWIDAAYRQGQATVNMRRGSEQYRALVADEPELRSMAETLDGEVIVVYHRRAYRFQP